jgi:hypothetical protein
MRLRTLLLFVALGFAALVGGGYWYAERQANSRRLARWQLQQEDDAIRARLEESIALPGGEMPLAAFARLIEERTGLRVTVDRSAQETLPAGSPPLKVRVPEGSFSLRSALRIALAPKRLWADVDRGGISITSIAAAADLSRMRTVVYPLPQPGPSGMDHHDWAEMVMANVEPGSWFNRQAVHLEAVPGALVVVHNEDAHRQIRELLATIAALYDPSKPLASVAVHSDLPSAARDGSIALPSRSSNAVYSRIAAALDAPASGEFVETPLHDVMDYLSDAHNVPIVLLSQPLADAGVSTDTPVTKALQGVSLRSLLRLLLGELELTFVVRDEALIITTPEDAESQLREAIYPVHDLIETLAGPDVDALLDVIAHTVFSASWSEYGGPGSLVVAGDGWLVVSQTDHVHQVLGQLLAQLRAALASEDAPRVVPTVPSPAAQRIRAALEQPLALDFQQLPLKDAVLYIGSALSTPIVLDARRLEEAGISVDTPITHKGADGPVRVQLELLLDQLDLAYVVHDEVLQITTPEAAESLLDTRIYDARALSGALLSTEMLGKLIRKVVAPHSWDEVGGGGSLMPLRDLLVVTQSKRAHREVERLLTALEGHCLADRSSEDGQWHVAPIDTGQSRRQIASALAKVISVELEDTPLEAALRQLAEVHGFYLFIDRNGLEEAGIGEGRSASLTANDMTLGGVLDRLLHPHDMDYAVHDHVLCVSGAPRIAGQHDIRLYRVADLRNETLNGAAVIGRALEAANLGDWKSREHNEWPDEPVIVPIEPDWLVVRAPREFHERAEDWLTERRTGQKPRRAIERERLPSDLEQLAVEGQKRLFDATLEVDPFAPPAAPDAGGSP